MSVVKYKIDEANQIMIFILTQSSLKVKRFQSLNSNITQSLKLSKRDVYKVNPSRVTSLF